MLDMWARGTAPLISPEDTTAERDDGLQSGAEAGRGYWPRRYGTSAMTVCSRPTSAALSRFAVWL